MSKNKPRNYTRKFMITKGIGATKVIPNKKKDMDKELSTSEYLEECLDDYDFYSNDEVYD